MTDETKALGNEEPSEGDLPETVESPAPALESQESPSEEKGQDAEYWKKIALGYKTKVEEANEVKRRLDDLESRSSQSPAAPGTQTEDDEDEQLLREAAKTKEGFWARKILQEREDREGFAKEVITFEQMRPIPEEKRKEAYVEYKKNPHLYASPIAAAKALEADRLAVQLADANRKLAAYEKKRPSEVEHAVPTDSRSAVKQPQSREWTEAQFDAERDRIRRTQGELAALQFSKSAPNQWKG